MSTLRVQIDVKLPEMQEVEFAGFKNNTKELAEDLEDTVAQWVKLHIYSPVPEMYYNMDVSFSVEIGRKGSGFVAKAERWGSSNVAIAEDKP
jgi:hypothetical protein